MGFLKGIRKRTRLPKKEPKGYAWPEKLSMKKKKKKKKLRDKTKYATAVSSTYEKTKNVRVYTFGSHGNSPFEDESTTICTTGTDSLESYGSKTERDYSAISFNVTFDSGDSPLSTPTVSSYSSEEREDADVLIEERDDLYDNISTRDIPESKNLNSTTTTPLLSSPRQCSPPTSTMNQSIHEPSHRSLETMETVETSNVSLNSSNSSDSRFKAQRMKDLRRTASDASKEYVHVFHQPLPPLEEDVILYNNIDVDTHHNSGDEADDELVYSDDDTTTSSSDPLPQRNHSRRFSLDSTEDESDLRQRWEFGLSMMSEIGVDCNQDKKIEVENDNKCINNSSDEINSLVNNDEYDEDNAEEI